MAEQDVMRGAQSLKFISLCGGPERDDGMETYVGNWGACLVVIDTIRSSEHDIADEGRWQSVRGDLQEGVYAGGWSCPPCGSFCANRGDNGGPRQVRGVHPSEL